MTNEYAYAYGEALGRQALRMGTDDAATAQWWLDQQRTHVAKHYTAREYDRIDDGISDVITDSVLV